MIITSSSGQTYGTFCGEWTGRTILAIGEHVLITFQSDSIIQERGFVMYFSTGPIGKHVAVRMRYVLARPWVGVRVYHCLSVFLLLFLCFLFV